VTVPPQPINAEAFAARCKKKLPLNKGGLPFPSSKLE